MSRPLRIIVGISGATEILYGVRLLQVLRETHIETHLVVTKAAEMTRAYETDLSAQQLRSLADVWYPVTDVGAAIASGSFKTMGMIVAPCSVRTMSEIAHGVTSNLLTRAAEFGPVIPKVIVLNDDIDASNTREVVWGFATRVRPISGEHFFNHEATSPLVAFLQASEKVSSHTTKVVYDGLAPDEWGERLPRRTSFKHNYSQELQDRIVRNWHLYGFR